MRARTLRDLTDDELDRKMAETRQELFNLRFQSATGALENSARLRSAKREIARILTVRHEREAQPGTEGEVEMAEKKTKTRGRRRDPGRGGTRHATDAASGSGRADASGEGEQRPRPLPTSRLPTMPAAEAEADGRPSPRPEADAVEAAEPVADEPEPLADGARRRDAEPGLPTRRLPKRLRRPRPLQAAEAPAA